jgi:hypothetical protein
MSSHRCSSPFCEDSADAALAFCFRHAAMVPAAELERLNLAWREMNREGSSSEAVSRFYKARQLAIDAAGPAMITRSEEDSSGPFRKLIERLTPLRKPSTTGYKGDIASVSRAQDDSFNHDSARKAWASKKRPPPTTQ